jgi:ABC-type nitrate/sulfonate/bicarbonate transport system substrate-binding protein
MLRFPILISLAAMTMTASAQTTTLRVKAFPGASALPLIAAASQGIFERHGLKVELLFTANSNELRDEAAKGVNQVSHAAVDNAVAVVERARADVVIVSGGDSSMNEFFVQPEVQSLADMKGRVLGVDAPNTAYALQAKKILLMNGLKEGRDYTLKEVGGTLFRYKAMREDKQIAATMLNPPFSVEAPAAGLKSLGRAVDLLGPYQASGAFVLRAWAKDNAALLERYLAALIEATRWVVAPENRAAGAKLLVERFKVAPQAAERTAEQLADPKFGLAPDARFNVEGFRNVLALRAEMEGDWGGKPPAADKYFDLSYYDRALKSLK